MSNPLARLTGVPKVVDAPEPAPPERKPARRPKAEETAPVKPVKPVEPVEPVEPTTDGKAAQKARLQADANELIALARDVEEIHLPVPERGQAKPEGTVAERWVSIWNWRLTQSDWLTSIHLPAGSYGIAKLIGSSEPGWRDILVEITLPVGGTVHIKELGDAVAQQFRTQYEIHRAARRGSNGELVILLIRRRAENLTEGFPPPVRRFYLDADHASGACR
ncbi:hypothetical protein [Tsukamurella paurometabola]|uniref:Uncharacterized protein n=1 Tax=Tsukamurella paurometabola TaxID=2061 RepID=A0A3P8MEL4_TSUPA|nr:hypothetical protein [Tsukamurella paurometabola]UEA83308.1 hypothetical protein LK411_00145 [Tsukamurella paurometabola]VDR40413.1 Uncharacterised protein [Tsukamurella paurometabola]